ncbi:MAG: protoporphyrinogen oxidase [Thermodesulfobacteriota bacterium]
MPKRIVIVGGGITGLSAAYRLQELEKERALELEILLFEKSDRLGGAIKTVSKDGYLIELGPDMFFTKRPWALDLSKRLGLESELIQTNESMRGTSVLWKGNLIPVPQGFLMLAPSKIMPFITSPLFSWSGKLRMLMELFISKKEPSDESLASFVRRRFGVEALVRVAQPMIGGIYTADPEKLSIQATMPQFLEMEQTRGSVIRAMLQNSGEIKGDSGARYSQFLSFNDGMETIVDKITSILPEDSLCLNEAVDKISKTNSTWEIETNNRKINCDGIIISTPAYHAASLVNNIDPSLGDDLSSIEHASSAVIALAYKKENIGSNLHGFGFVVPDVEGIKLIACSYSSTKFDGRAPDGHVLLRAFVGGALNPSICELEDTKIIGQVTQELNSILNIKSDPDFTMIERYPDAMPQYHIGHVKKVEQIKQRVTNLKGLEIAGNAYNGVGIPDTIHSGELAAESIIDQLF